MSHCCDSNLSRREFQFLLWSSSIDRKCKLLVPICRFNLYLTMLPGITYSWITELLLKYSN